MNLYGEEATYEGIFRRRSGWRTQRDQSAVRSLVATHDCCLKI